jgi:hypothetical protein
MKANEAATMIGEQKKQKPSMSTFCKETEFRLIRPSRVPQSSLLAFALRFGCTPCQV